MRFITIYDLRILPLALGDMISWVANKKLDSIEQGIDKYDLAIVMPQNFKGNLLNEIRSYKYWLNHLNELKMIFESDILFDQVYIVNSIKEIKSIYVNKEIELNLLNNIITDQRNENKIREYIEEFQRYDRFNKVFNDYKIKIVLESKISYLNEAIELLNNTNLSDEVIICQPRFRAIDSGLPHSDPKRDSNFMVWYDFLNLSKILNCNINYLMVGRSESLPVELKQFGNCFFSRDIGMNLAHEIALIRNSNYFIGASSGFAVVANFSNTCYQIYNVKKGGYDNFGINPDKSELIFSSKNQKISSSDISINSLENIKDLFGNKKILYKFLNKDYKMSNVGVSKPSLSYILTLLSSDLEIIAMKFVNNKDLEIIDDFEEKLNKIWPNSNIFIQTKNKKMMKLLNITVCNLILLRINTIRLYVKYKDYYEIALKYVHYGLFSQKLIKFIKKRVSYDIK